MRESISYTVILNIAIVFITIIVAFLLAALVYFKSNKASNVITSAIEKYEGYNALSYAEIIEKLSTLGYGFSNTNCKEKHNGCSRVDLDLVGVVSGADGFCVYECSKEETLPDGTVDRYYYYKIKTMMNINIPIVNDILSIPIYSNSNKMYDYTSKFK